MAVSLPNVTEGVACGRHVFETTWGHVGVEATDSSLTALYLPGCLPDGFSSDVSPFPVLLEVEEEIREYFAGKRRGFTVGFEPGGTVFMRAVWHQLCLIPFGELRTYGDIAKALGNPGASRAVGMACGRNPLPLVIPCHRVVGVGNRLTGFSGGGVKVKRRLIEHEGTAGKRTFT